MPVMGGLERHDPEAVAFARNLASRRKRKLSLREISAELAVSGHLNERGKGFRCEVHRL
jgi:hypothetical protein